MKNKASASLGKIPQKSDYHQEVIVKPAEKLLKALIETEIKEKEIIKKSKTAIFR